MFSTIRTYNTTTINCNYIQSLVASVNPQQRKPETKITTEYYYVGGPMGNVAVYISENGAEPELYYTITDHLGSIVAIADEDGEIIEEQRYDPWGNYRNPLTGTPEENPQLTKLFRGYTGHEMLPEFGLINMNGRLYDPVIARVLSPDNNVQNPYNPQNYNRYSYCYNNPLVYTDPDGQWVHLVVGAAIGGTMNLIVNWNNVDNFWQGLGYFGIGAAAGALGAGVGAGVGVAYTGAGTFGAGFMGTASVTSSSLGFVGGFASGFGGGFSSGFISGTGNSLMGGNAFGQSLGVGLTDGIKLGLIGGSIGGIIGGISSTRAGNHPLTGKPPYKDISLDIPYISQTGEMDCLLANSEMIEKYHGGTRTQEDFRIILESLPEGATTNDYFNAAGFKIMGEPDNALHVIRTMEVNKFPTTITTVEGPELFHSSTIVRARMWTPNSKAVFWTHDPIRGANYRWTQKQLYKVIWDRLTIGGLR